MLVGSRASEDVIRPRATVRQELGIHTCCLRA